MRSLPPSSLALASLVAWSLALAAARAPADSPPTKGTRTIVLVRHGIYDDQDPRDPDVGKALIPLGEEQARRAGERLAKWPLRVGTLHSSSMTRARQTAEIIGQALDRKPTLTTELRECTPPTDRPEVGKEEFPGERDSCRIRLEAAWTRYFRPTNGADSVDVLVCHGNVIRWLLARSIGLDPGLWLNLTTHNGGFTVIEARPDGRVRLVAFNDTGHLPKELVTPAPRTAAPPTPPAPR